MKLNTFALASILAGILFAENVYSAEKTKPYASPCTERENVFAFTEKPKIQFVGDDKYEITFAVKGYCDVTVGLIDAEDKVVRHLGSGVLGANAPEPFQKNSKKQKIYWNGKDDFESYIKDPNKLRVRVMLGLKPTFDKLLGGTSPYNLPGFVWGIAADPEGVFVFVRGINRGHVTCRAFDHDFNYKETIWPPAGNLPPEKLGGMGYVEYEPGKKSVQAPNINRGTYRGSLWLPGGIGGEEGQEGCRPAVMDGRIYLLDSGYGPGSDSKNFVHMLHYLKTDGTTDYKGMQGVLWEVGHQRTTIPQLAISEKNKNIYLVGWCGRGGKGKSTAEPVVMRRGLSGDAKKAEVVAGKLRKPGNDNQQLNKPSDVACDAAGRVYVVDNFNSRIQIFDGDGKYLKTIKVERPTLIQVHQKTGAVYVAHQTRVKGLSQARLIRYGKYPDLKKETQFDLGAIEIMTLDSWSPKPRLWIGTERLNFMMARFTKSKKQEGGLRVYEDVGDKLNLLCDFDEKARKAAGDNYAGRFDGGCMNQVNCDPVREKVYYKMRAMFDLKTGKYEGWTMGRKPENITTDLMTKDAGGHWGVKIRGGEISEFTFDKHGFMHSHMGSIQHGTPAGAPITRVNPDRVVKTRFSSHYEEVPYDYGVEWRAANAEAHDVWKGVIGMPPRNRLGYAWGLGANMRGELGLVFTTMYKPKTDADGFKSLFSGMIASGGISAAGKMNSKYKEYVRTLKDVDKQGGKMFFLKQEPGVPVTGATVWTFDRYGEVRYEAGVVAGEWNNGLQIDEDGYVYFTNVRFAARGNKPFLWNSGGNFGGKPLHKLNHMPFNSAYIKTRGNNVRFLSKKQTQSVPVPLDTDPNRPPDLLEENTEGLPGGGVWINDYEWIYAGSGPVVAQHCHCPQMRGHMDWYKRSYVPEPYRHSVGILDTNGNLIMHLGRYGNIDSGYGPDSKVPLEGDGISTTMIRFVSGTDNYFCIADWGQRIIVTKLNYHAEETIPIKLK